LLNTPSITNFMIAALALGERLRPVVELRKRRRIDR
jgi:hypothetical protein